MSKLGFSSMPKKTKAAFKTAKDEFNYQLDEAEFSNALWSRKPFPESRQAQGLNPVSLKNSAAVMAATGLDGEQKVNEKANANLPLTNFLKLMEEASANLDDPAPSKFIVNASTYKIVTEKGFARFHMKFGLRVLEDGWVSIPLLTHRAAVVTSQVTRIDQKSENSGSAPKTWSFCVLPGGKDSTQGLLTNISGDFVVDIEALVPYANLRETGLLLSVPNSVSNELMLDVGGTQLDIKVEPAISSETTVAEDLQRTRLKCRLPPTNRLMLQWTEKLVELDSEPAIKEHLPLTITSEQYVLHSIGEGVLSSKVVMKYVIQNGSVSLFELAIDARVRLLNVVGTGLKRWEVVEQEFKDPAAVPLNTDDADAPKKVKRPHRVLKAYMDYGMEDAYELTISTELSMGDTSAKVIIPTQKSLGVSREKGHIGLEARTNVELQEVQARGLAMTDVGELPVAVTDLASNAVLLGYKFLDPAFVLEVDVKKHGDVGVLIAIVEECHVDITAIEAGSMLTRLSAKVRNTQKQFLRIKLPVGAHIWSTFSANQPVKPAFDEKDKALMVPLHKSKLGDSNNGGSFVVEVVYLYDANPMGNRGTLDVKLPSLDIPSNIIKVLLHLPGDFRYGEFEGDLKETNDRYLPQLVGTLNMTQMPVRQQQQQMQMNMNTNPMVVNFEDTAGDDQVLFKTEHAGEYNRVRGVLPVRVDRLQIAGSSQYSFERALVGSDVVMGLSAPFKKVSAKGCCSRRRVGGCSLM